MTEKQGWRESLGVSAGAAWVEVDGVLLAYSRQGSGQAVVCLHAVAHGARDFEPFALAMAGEFEIICIDWPNHGRSGPDKLPTSAARYADILEAVLCELDIRRPIIVGCSIGGAAAIIHASKHPDRVKALVLCNPGGLVKLTKSVQRAILFVASFFAAGARGAKWFGFAYRQYYRRLVLPQRAARPQRERIIAAGYEMAPTLQAAWESFAQPEADLREAAASLPLPVWFAWAQKDRLIQLKACLPAINKMQHATLTKFNAGHAAFLEQPKRFAKEFRSFAARL